jgi:predicted RecB family nuclease
MRLTASDIYAYFCPSKCDLRVYLREMGEQEAPPGPFEEVLRRLGERHEKIHLATFPVYADLSSGTEAERELRTREEVKQETGVIYQPFLRTPYRLEGVECDIVGAPDFLIFEGGGYVIRDSKISRRITGADHPEILRQLELYGWLYERAFGQPPLGLQVHSGTGEIVPLPYQSGTAALEALREILALKRAGSEPYHPVGWSKCANCSFKPRCWPKAEESRDVALVVGVDQNLARALRQEGIRTVDQLLDRFDEASLAEFTKPWGKRTQRVGKAAWKIIRMAQALASGKESLLQPPEIPEHPNYAMLDLEGMPPYMDELDKIYLWGFQVFGDRPGKYQAAMAGFGVDGDLRGWEEFLAKARKVLEEYGEIRFVHWAPYEKGRLGMYMERFGDPGGIAARVREKLLDLLPITQKSLALPLPSYSLKVVEKYAGYQRKMEEYGGDWAMAKYIEATETEDKTQRDQVMEEIKAYNREDLEATWTVLQWLKAK